MSHQQPWRETPKKAAAEARTHTHGAHAHARRCKHATGRRMARTRGALSHAHTQADQSPRAHALSPRGLSFLSRGPSARASLIIGVMRTCGRQERETARKERQRELRICRIGGPWMIGWSWP